MKALLLAPAREGNPVPGKARRSNGFSMTELLVVIAMIAIMAGMLMPALSKGKRQAIAAACLSNQKLLAGAFHMYSQDNADRIVQMADYVTGEMFYPAGGFWGGPMPGPSWPTATEAVAAVENGLRSSNALYFYCNNLNVYHCPGDPRMFRSPNGHDLNGWAYDSYARTQNLGGEPFDNYWGAGATYEKMSAIFVPGATFSMIEAADWRGFNVGTWAVNWMGKNSFEWQDPPAIWHANVCSIGFADGHGALHRWVDPTIVSAGRSTAEGREESTWARPERRMPDYQFVYSGYQFPGHP